MTVIIHGGVVDIYTDGSSKPNSPTGKARVGIVFVFQDKIIYESGTNIGRGTNNYAEFVAVNIALTRAYEMGFRRANVFGDSTLVIDGINGRINIKKPTLLRQYMATEYQKTLYDWITFTYIPRNTGYHKIADQLSKQ